MAEAAAGVRGGSAIAHAVIRVGFSGQRGVLGPRQARDRIIAIAILAMFGGFCQDVTDIIIGVGITQVRFRRADLLQPQQGVITGSSGCRPAWSRGRGGSGCMTDSQSRRRPESVVPVIRCCHCRCN